MRLDGRAALIPEGHRLAADRLYLFGKAAVKRRARPLGAVHVAREAHHQPLCAAFARQTRDFCGGFFRIAAVDDRGLSDDHAHSVGNGNARAGIAVVNGKNSHSCLRFFFIIAAGRARVKEIFRNKLPFFPPFRYNGGKFTGGGRFMRKKIEHILHTTLHVLELTIAIGTLIVLIGMLGLEIYHMVTQADYFSTLDHFLHNILTIVVGLEFVRMLVDMTPANTLEVLIVAISRHVILSHDDPLSNIACVLCIAALFATRRFLIPKKEMKLELSEVD